MNDITTQLFELLATNSEVAFQRIKTIFELSDMAEKAGLNKLSIELNAKCKPAINNRNGFLLSIVNYAIHHLNLAALRYLVEERKFSLDKCEPSPLFVVLCLKADENPQKIETIVDYLLENGLNINYQFSDTVYFNDRTLGKAMPLHLTMHKARMEIARKLLLQGADHHYQDSYSSCSAYKLAGPDYSNVPEIYRMIECKESIENAKKSWEQKNYPKLMRDIGLAFENDPKFLVDYLAHQFKAINLAQAPEQDYSYLIKFIDVFVFLTHSEFNESPAVFKIFQESVLPELGGYDVSTQKIKVFPDSATKQAYFLRLSQGTQWEQSAKIMNNSTSTATLPFSFMPPPNFQSGNSNTQPNFFTFGSSQAPTAR